MQLRIKIMKPIQSNGETAAGYNTLIYKHFDFSVFNVYSFRFLANPKL